MRLANRLLQTVTVKPAAAPPVYTADDRLYRFDDAQAFTMDVTLQPVIARTDAAVYGETEQGERLMLYRGKQMLTAGMGVCVEVPGSAACDYRTAGRPRQYPEHSEITLQYIPPERRA